MIQAQVLNNLTDSFEHCQIAAYADISTGVALLTAGDDHVPREVLNELCSEAGLSLGAPEAPAFGGEGCSVAIKAAEKSVLCYFRAPDAPREAYLFMCHPDIDLSAFITQAQANIGEGVMQ